MKRAAEHEIDRLLGEIKRLVKEADTEPGQNRGRAAAATLELDALRWRLAAIVSRDSAYDERTAA
jgi:hypothetical protein